MIDRNTALKASKRVVAHEKIDDMDYTTSPYFSDSRVDSDAYLEDVFVLKNYAIQLFVLDDIMSGKV